VVAAVGVLRSLPAWCVKFSRDRTQSVDPAFPRKKIRLSSGRFAFQESGPATNQKFIVDYRQEREKIETKTGPHTSNIAVR
jgi:hypothetical protein